MKKKKESGKHVRDITETRESSVERESSEEQKKLPLVHEVREKMGILIDQNIDRLTCGERSRLAEDLSELLWLLEDCNTGDCP